MAILLKESKFTDIYGNVTNQFKANAGDSIIIEHTFESEISFISSVNNQITINNLESKVARANGSFLNDGFRIGQTYVLYDVTNTNTINNSFTGTILSVTDLEMKMTGLPNLNNWSNGNSFTIVILANGNFDSLNFAFNFVDNELPKSSSPSLESLIDQETSRFNVNGISSLAIDSSLPLIQVGKKSGQFEILNTIVTRLTDIINPYTAFSSVRKRYKITLEVIFIGMFSTDSFIGEKCLKYYSRSSFKVLTTENLAPTIIEFNENANTGLWNEGFNEDQPDSNYSTNINEIYFNTFNTLIVEASCPTSLNITEVELGAMYLTIDDDYNKNLENSQSELLPFLKTGLIGTQSIGNTYTSTTNYPFYIYLNDFYYQDLNGTRTFTLVFILQPEFSETNSFGKFIQSRGELDRQFLVWLKVGNTNRLLFNNQITYLQPEGEVFESLTNFINHDNNLNYKNLDNINLYGNSDFNIEDDIAYISEFSLYTTDANKSITAKVIVVNTDTEEQFILDKIYFDLSTQDLKYFINQYIPSTNNLPNSSNKKEAFLIQKTPLSDNEIQVRLFYPIVIDWRYWEEVMVTSPYFVSQNKNNSNWFNYNDNPWRVFVKVEIERNELIDYNYRPLNFKNYDDWEGTSTIELYDKNETSISKVLLPNTTMLIKATHVFLNDYAEFPYGMITIEPQESSPRFILSTEINRVQSNNPLTGISEENRCDMEFFDSKTIILRCYVNTNILNGRNFCISSKISDDGTNNNLPMNNKLTESNDDKITENVEFKILE